eukprot:1047060-Amphidinium_carterae.1
MDGSPPGNTRFRIGPPNWRILRVSCSHFTHFQPSRLLVERFNCPLAHLIVFGAHSRSHRIERGKEAWRKSRRRTGKLHDYLRGDGRIHVGRSAIQLHRPSLESTSATAQQDAWLFLSRRPHAKALVESVLPHQPQGGTSD